MRPMRFTDELITEYTEKGYWPAESYADLYERNAREYPNREALTANVGKLPKTRSRSQPHAAAPRKPFVPEPSAA